MKSQTPEQARRHAEIMAGYNRLKERGVIGCLPVALCHDASRVGAAVTAAKCMAIEAQAATGERIEPSVIRDAALQLLLARSTQQTPKHK